MNRLRSSSNFRVRINDDGVVEVGGELDDDDDDNDDDDDDNYGSDVEDYDDNVDGEEFDAEFDDGVEHAPGQDGGSEETDEYGRRLRRPKLLSWWEWFFKDFWVSTKTMLKRKSREVRSDMETKGMRYKAWSKLKTVYGERFILLLTDQVR